MLLLLLLCHARAEWVQISQLHYRKPVDQASFQPLTRPEPTEKPNWANQTLPRWKPGTVQRVPHLGTVKRVHVERPRNKKHEKQAASDDDDKLSLSMDKLDFGATEEGNKGDIAITTVITTKKPSVVHEPVSIKRNPFLTVVPKRTTTPGPTLATVLDNKQTPYKNTTRVYIGSGESIDHFDLNFNEETDTHKANNNHDVILKKYDIVHDNDTPFVTKQNALNNGKVTETKGYHKDEDKNTNVTSISIEKVDTTVHENNTNSTPTIKSDKVESSANQTNVNTIENVLKILKVVADTISRNTKSNVESKLKYLHNLKNTILANIEVRLESLWPAGGARRARALAARGHVDFPSSESALMTISFLTFAVFLIKLVLQVIQKYKNSSMLMSPALVASVRRLHTAPAHQDTTLND